MAREHESEHQKHVGKRQHVGLPPDHKGELLQGGGVAVGDLGRKLVGQAGKALLGEHAAPRHGLVQAREVEVEPVVEHAY